MSAIEMIQAERARQISKGFDAAHDDQHEGAELVCASDAYLLARRGGDEAKAWGEAVWPWDDESFHPKASEIENIVIAAAFLVAEIERQQRAAK